ncbi:folylpolyglutamate synthase [Neosynechococcus sphagnicola sy1]|uniref:tetrahydrofolate synthase n=1 Tax=Neosynechococcus sphagnicola sy1 TaxID=1497020 RepID=A0A098TJT4_9CYAN|nr:folylpolyglutamate synthase/dihydrofolate synthase family protein [Neosynechococcus sphagnicola]KGF72097.1 folylpolyglutamate synthase [Neosynechococcus sphagnicola sy1]
MDVDTILEPYQRFGVHLGLDRIQSLLANLGNPQQQYPIIHVAGSNGKGSVCAYLSGILTAAGYRVGRYTSPHLVNWCERICLNEEAIAPIALQQVLEQVEAAISPLEMPTQFEVITAASWLYFAQQQVEIAIVEVGLGGRLDATNVCDRPLVSIITSLSREHWQVLGPTLADIAREKAGILKVGSPAIVGLLPAEAAVVVAEQIAALNCPVDWPESAQEIPRPTDSGSPKPMPWAEFRGIQYPLPLAGEVQLRNSSLAIAAVQVLRQQGWSITDAAIQDGMAHTHWPGRLQWVHWQEHRLLIDGAHNPAAAGVLRQFVDRLGDARSVQWVMGMLSTKDHSEIFQTLLRSGDALYLVPVPDHSSANPIELTQLAQRQCPGLTHCQPYPDLASGLQAAFQDSSDFKNQDDIEPLTILCGSLYLIGHFFKHQDCGSKPTR